MTGVTESEDRGNIVWRQGEHSEDRGNRVWRQEETVWRQGGQSEDRGNRVWRQGEQSEDRGNRVWRRRLTESENREQISLKTEDNSVKKPRVRDYEDRQ